MAALSMAVLVYLHHRLDSTAQLSTSVSSSKTLGGCRLFYCIYVRLADATVARQAAHSTAPGCWAGSLASHGKNGGDAQVAGRQVDASWVWRQRHGDLAAIVQELCI
jgi:hypothetical protein